uniref:NS3 protein n=2 Tax=Baku virus TaxID=1484571 RepID=A0A3P8MIG2_9REOV|nr:NS3 protein [Baku virus]
MLAAADAKRREQTVGTEMQPLVPSAPRPLSGPMPEMALGVLQNALTSTTGANETAKNEKAAYGAAAEVMRDDPATRQLKAHVNLTAVLELEERYKRVRRKKCACKWLQAASSTLILLISIAMSIASASLWIESTLVKKGVPVYMIISGLTTVAMVTGRMHAHARTAARTIKRDLVKKRSYVQLAVAMGTPLPGTAPTPAGAGAPSAPTTIVDDLVARGWRPLS